MRVGERTPLEPVRVMPAQGSVDRPPLLFRPDPVRSSMNANDQFFARDAKVDSAAIAPLPASRRIYVEGSRADLRVPMREIGQTDTPSSFGAESNPPLAVYDTSGPYTDPDAQIDIRQGLPALRARWIDERGDTATLDAPTSAFGRARLADHTLDGLRFDLHRPPRRAKSGANVTQMH